MHISSKIYKHAFKFTLEATESSSFIYNSIILNRFFWSPSKLKLLSAEQVYFKKTNNTHAWNILQDKGISKENYTRLGNKAEKEYIICCEYHAYELHTNVLVEKCKIRIIWISQGSMFILTQGCVILDALLTQN